MKKIVFILTAAIFTLYSCESENATTVNSASTSEFKASKGGQEAIVDDVSAPDLVKLAVANEDLSTLVKAVQAADLTTSLSNAGPFTVFAPLNSAFDQLPDGVLADLMKPENVNQLDDILRHHTYVGVINPDQFKDGQILGMVDGKSITIKMVDGKPTVNGTANIVASVTAANGIVHVVDQVILAE